MRIAMAVQAEQRLAILIDADNISASLAGDIFKKAYAIGTPIARRAYGMVNCFTADGGWARAQREYGVVARPQVSNVSGKNVADIALVIDAMEFRRAVRRFLPCIRRYVRGWLEFQVRSAAG